MNVAGFHDGLIRTSEQNDDTQFLTSLRTHFKQLSSKQRGIIQDSIDEQLDSWIKKHRVNKVK